MGTYVRADSDLNQKGISYEASSQSNPRVRELNTTEGGYDPENEPRKMFWGPIEEPSNLADITTSEEWKYRCNRTRPAAGGTQIMHKSRSNCSRFTEDGSVVSNSIDGDG